MKRLILIVSGLIVFLSVSFITTFNLYTEEKVKKIGKYVGNSAFNGALDLGYLLGYNYNEYEEEFVTFSSDKYSNKWRDMLASNPTLLYSAFDLYYDEFFESFRQGFEDSKKWHLERIISNKSNMSDYEYQYDLNIVFSKNSDDFISLQFVNMRKYQILIDDLLKLDDQKLNSMILSIPKDPCCNYSENFVEANNLKKWLISKGHIVSDEEIAKKGLPWNKSAFPTDVLLLTYRISSNYPSWTNRRVLQEIKKFSEYIQSKVVKK